MNAGLIVELIGYLGSALVLVSMLMTSVVKLRVINLIGSVIFAGYALMIRSYPTALMNFCLAGINIFHLWRLTKEQKHYELVSTDPADGYLNFLIQSYEEDIRKWFPAFSMQDRPANRAYLMCCDGSPAGIFLGKLTEDNELEVLLDYALPAYRDTSVGRFLYRKLAQAEYRSLVFRQDAPDHTQYLEKLGYQKNEAGEYTLDLSRWG